MNRSNYLVRQFEVAWEKVKASGKPKLFMLMLRLNGKHMLLAMLPRLIFDITMFIPIVAQTYMIEFAQKCDSKATISSIKNQSGAAPRAAPCVIILFFL
jgi:ATP-binding cassette subfamily C (CFTR/MRP) protein 2